MILGENLIQFQMIFLEWIINNLISKENVHFHDITNLFLVHIFDSVLPHLY